MFLYTMPYIYIFIYIYIKIKKISSTHSPWKMRLEAKTTRREVSQLGLIQKGVELVKDKTRLLGKYKGLSSHKALETAKQRLAALATEEMHQRGSGKKGMPCSPKNCPRCTPSSSAKPP